jgi:HAD superfamily hydrolase (TIGR01662 family)
VPRTAAVLFDVDFTLIHPGPRFQGAGYASSCAAYGIEVDSARFAEAVAGASVLLESPDQLYNDQIFVRYTRRIIELMGGTGPHIDVVARLIYEDWAEHRHFVLYDDVPEALRQLKAQGLKLGLISNSHRPLDSFGSHFDLDGLISATDHGFLKPHPSIFRAALELMSVSPDEAVMVGDSVVHDIVGAHQAGMRGILLARGDRPALKQPDIPVIRSLSELPALLAERT